MNSLSSCSRVELIQDLLQVAHTSRSPLVCIFHRDPQSLGDLVGLEFFVVGQFQYLTVLVVFDLADGPQNEALFALLFQFLADPVRSLFEPRSLPGSKGTRVGTGLALGVVALVEAPR